MARIAAIQMTSSHKVDENLNTVAKWVAKAKDAGALMVLLPENFAFMGMNESDKLNVAESFGKGPIQDFLSRLAKIHGIWLVAGTLPLQASDPRKVTATTLVFDPKGQCVGRYDKIHLFDVEVDSQEAHTESRTVDPGNRVVSLVTPIATLGLTICYDLRFPELYRRLFNEGAEVITVPSAFTQKTGEAHWVVLLRARAIENFCYVIAANQSGTHSNGRTTFGHSMIVDPWGKVLDSLASGEGMVMAEINLDYLKDIRRRFPVLQHQRIGQGFENI